MVNQEYFSDDRISKANFLFLPACSKIYRATQLDKANVEKIFRTLTLILPLYDGSD